MRHPGPGNSYRPRPQPQPPQPPTQLQANANPNPNPNPVAPGNPQGFLGNPSQGNAPFMFQSSVPMQPSMGGTGINPPTFNNPSTHQNPPTFNNPSTHQSNGQFMPNMHPLMMQQPGYFNPPPMMAPQPNPGFPHPSNMGGGVPMFANQLNPFQQGQLVQQLANLVQHLSQNVGLLNMPHQMQNMNSMLPLQAPNLPPGFIPPNCNPPPVPPNPNMFSNPMFGAVQQPNPNHQNFVMQPMGANLSNSSLATAEQRPPGNPSAAEQAFQSQPSFSSRQQGNLDGNAQGNRTNPQWRNSTRNDFNKNFNREGSQPGSNKPHYIANDNKKRKFELKGAARLISQLLYILNSLEETASLVCRRVPKRHGYERSPKFGGTNSPSQAAEKKRTLVVNYPEHEVNQWRELRKKNYPTKSNVEKKQALKLADAEAIEKEATLRREQLKEVLAKQAELGVEVAEVPSHYLLDSNKQVNGEGDGRWQKKKGRFQNKHDNTNNKRERRNKRGRKYGNHATASTQEDHPSGISAANKKQPTLLEKLLSRDIKRDNQRLLQAFRFMATNSFFKDGPGKPLRFPRVVVQEGSNERGAESLGVENNGDGEEEGHDHDNGKEEQQMGMKPMASFTQGRRDVVEEGEIND